MTLNVQVRGSRANTTLSVDLALRVSMCRTSDSGRNAAIGAGSKGMGTLGARRLNPDHHFVVGPTKFDFCAMGSYQASCRRSLGRDTR